MKWWVWKALNCRDVIWWLWTKHLNTNTKNTQFRKGAKDDKIKSPSCYRVMSCYSVLNIGSQRKKEEEEKQQPRDRLVLAGELEYICLNFFFFFKKGKSNLRSTRKRLQENRTKTRRVGFQSVVTERIQRMNKWFFFFFCCFLLFFFRVTLRGNGCISLLWDEIFYGCIFLIYILGFTINVEKERGRSSGFFS